MHFTYNVSERLLGQCRNESADFDVFAKNNEAKMDILNPDRDVEMKKVV